MPDSAFETKYLELKKTVNELFDAEDKMDGNMFYTSICQLRYDKLRELMGRKKRANRLATDF